MRDEPANRPSAALHGAKWIMLQQNTASAYGIGHFASDAFKTIAGQMRELRAPLVWASMSVRASTLASLGCHTRSLGSLGAMNAACSPVPLAISSSIPVFGSAPFS